MQDPTQPTLPVDPQAVTSTDQLTQQSQAVSDTAQTVADPTQVVDPQTTDLQPGESPPDQNPLDVLESILAEAKQKAGQKSPAGETSGGGEQVANSPAATTDPATPPVPPPPTPEEIAAKEAIHQAEIEQQKQQLMAQISQTPEYQAKVQQDAEKAEEESQSSAGGDGFQIQQLQHTKM